MMGALAEYFAWSNRGVLLSKMILTPVLILPHLLTARSKFIRPSVVTMSLQTHRSSTEPGQPDEDAFAFAVKGTPKACRAVLPVFIASSALGGCASHGAPSFVLFGAFFPAWMLCALIGILERSRPAASSSPSGLDSVLPFQLFVCSSVGLVVAALTWLIWFGQ